MLRRSCLFNGHFFQRLRPGFHAFALRARVCPRRSSRRRGYAAGGGGWRPEPVRRYRVPGASLLPLRGLWFPVPSSFEGGCEFVRSDGELQKLDGFVSPVFAVGISFIHLIKERKCESNPSSPTLPALHFWGRGISLSGEISIPVLIPPTWRGQF